MTRSSDTASEHDLLHAAVVELGASAHFPIAFGGLVNRGAVTITSLVGNRRDSLTGLRVETDRGLGGRAMSEVRPRITTDYRASRHITHDYDEAVLGEGIRSLLAVPVIVDRTVRAVIYGGIHAEATVGSVLAEPAIRIAQELGRELAVREEVERRIAGMRRRPDEGGAGISAAQLADLREGVAELRGIANAVAHDPELRARIAAVESRLAALGGVTVPRTGIALSPRELDVLGYVGIGTSNAEIARALQIAESTVKAYLGTAMSKLGASTRFQAVQEARRAGLLP
ncbi:MAG: LuxR C-terminal-related transcriptional regulator [Rhodoglobus sp.]